MEASSNMPATPFYDEHDPLTAAKVDILMFHPSTAIFGIAHPDSTTSQWSPPSPLPSQQDSIEFVQSTAHMLISVFDQNHQQDAIWNNNTISEKNETAKIQSHLLKKNISLLHYSLTLTPSQSHRPVLRPL